MITFTDCGGEIRTNRVSSGNKLDLGKVIWQHKPLKHVLISFDGDAENILLRILMHLQIVSTYTYSDC